MTCPTARTPSAGRPAGTVGGNGPGRRPGPQPPRAPRPVRPGGWPGQFGEPLPRHPPACEDQVECVAHADEPRQPDGPAVDEGNPPAPAVDAEHGISGRHPEVAPERQFEAAGNCVTLDGS